MRARSNGVISKPRSFCCVRWYLRYSLSYRDLEEMMAERSLHVDHTTIFRWVQCYAPELPNWRSALDLTSKPVMTPGGWMKHISRSKKRGPISTEPSIKRGTRSSSSSASHGMLKQPGASSSKHCIPLLVQPLEPV